MFTKPLLTYAENIGGWMTHEELKWLAKQAMKHQRIVEVGSYMGRATRALGDNTKGIVYAIDDFKGPRDMSLPSGIRDNLLEIFLHASADLIQVGRVVPVAADHAQVNVESPDMVFIDGGHEYYQVKRDIEHWKAKIAPGGLICGHDYTNIFDVRQAVKESFKSFKVARNTSIWYAKA